MCGRDHSLNLELLRCAAQLLPLVVATSFGVPFSPGWENCALSLYNPVPCMH